MFFSTSEEYLSPVGAMYVNLQLQVYDASVWFQHRTLGCGEQVVRNTRLSAFRKAQRSY